MTSGMTVQKIRPSLRLLCGGVGAILMMGTFASWRAGYGLAGTVALGLVTACFLVVGAGSLEEDGEGGSSRFRELADPARSLSPDDLQRAAPEAAPVRR
jgi:hypothetical protein